LAEHFVDGDSKSGTPTDLRIAQAQVIARSSDLSASPGGRGQYIPSQSGSGNEVRGQRLMGKFPFVKNVAHIAAHHQPHSSTI